jgi:membrane associated rhomboid family serine protease
MTISALTIIMIATVLVSLKAMSDEGMKEKMMYSPYLVKNSKESYRIISHIFIHGDMGHLLFNMMSLYFLGQVLEYELIATYGLIKGEVHFVSLYFIGALFATIIPYLRNQDNPSYRSLGASGAVSAVIFAAILWRPDMDLQFIFIPVPFKAYWFGLFYLGYEIYMDKRGNTGIAHDAHLGGAILGIIYILVINPERGINFINQFIS